MGLLLTGLFVKYFSLDSGAVYKNLLILICLKSQGRIEINLWENTLKYINYMFWSLSKNLRDAFHWIHKFKREIIFCVLNKI